MDLKYKKTIEIPAFNRGTYDCEGETKVKSLHYYLRWDDSLEPNDRARSFFAFDLSKVKLSEHELITAAVIKIEMPSRGYASPNQQEGFVVYVVEFNKIDDLLSGSKDVSSFEALADGSIVGEAIVNESTEGSIVEVELDKETHFIIDQKRESANSNIILGCILRPEPKKHGVRRLFHNSKPKHKSLLVVSVEAF